MFIYLGEPTHMERCACVVHVLSATHNHLMTEAKQQLLVSLLDSGYFLEC